MNNKYLKISSKGIIDINGFILLGASSKRNDSGKIGMFGSGLKYSIAFLLRSKIPFVVFSGEEKIEFTTTTVQFRDQEFEQIHINGEKTSMTTAMGVDWSYWSSVREIYSNSIDEGEEKIEVVDDNIEFDSNKTIFYIELTSEVQEILTEWNNYFSNERKDLLYCDKDMNQIYSGNDSTIVYRKGIQCRFIEKQRSVFHYDLTFVEINESRIVKDDWTFKWNLGKFLQKCSEPKIITQIYAMIENCWEKYIQWDSNCELFSETWLTEINKRALVPTENAGFWSELIKKNPTHYLILPDALVRGLKQKFNDQVRVVGEEEGGGKTGELKVLESLSPKQQYLLKEVMNFFKEANYNIQFDVKICNFSSKTALGLAHENTIFISERLFDSGKKLLAAVIMEENEHLITGFSDETRQFQSHIFEMVVTQMEEKCAIFL